MRAIVVGSLTPRPLNERKELCSHKSNLRSLIGISYAVNRGVSICEMKIYITTRMEVLITSRGDLMPGWKFFLKEKNEMAT